tara:strand:+ start:15155 stop:15556 length:402 start_codon:yes stop_codon:yes gene_type:complete
MKKTTAEKPSGSPQGVPEMSAANTFGPYQEAAGLEAANTFSLPDNSLHNVDHLDSVAQATGFLEAVNEDSVAEAAANPVAADPFSRYGQVMGGASMLLSPAWIDEDDFGVMEPSLNSTTAQNGNWLPGNDYFY